MAFLRAGHFVVATPNNHWLFLVAGKDGKEHFVSCHKELVLAEQEHDWIPVAICAKDDGRQLILVEFPSGNTEAVNRLWVRASEVRSGDTHVDSYSQGTVFPVLQLNMESNLTAWNERIQVVKIEATAEAAQIECDRQNSLNRHTNRLHFWQATKAPAQGQTNG